jgi:predicted nucleotidyltransferase
MLKIYASTFSLYFLAESIGGIMKTCGIVAEYNPFHQGHIHHLKQARLKTGADALVVILTGAFGSRGLPSLIDTAAKTRLALDYGADLVIELPVVYAAQSADQFAKYAIQSLSSLHIDLLCFGSETNDIKALEELLPALEQMQKDPSCSLAQNTAANLAALRPNDILGLQYIRYCKQYGIQPVSIQRSSDFKSATATRKEFYDGQKQFMQEHFLKEQNWQNYYPYLRLFLQMSSAKSLSKFFLVEEGIENRLKEQARLHDNWQDFLEGCISKTYTRNRIMRTCLFCLLQIEKEDMEKYDSYFDIKVLGFNQIGQQILKSVKKEGHIKSRFADLNPFMAQVQAKTEALYNSVLNNPLPSWKVVQV